MPVTPGNMASRRYRLSGEAVSDLERLHEYGLIHFGYQRASAYYAGFRPFFEALAENPFQAPRVDHVRKGYRRGVYNRHSVYFRVEDESIVIVRILGRQDAAGGLPERY